MTEDVKTRLMNLRVLPGEQERWKSEAERSGLSLSAWVRMVCNGAAPEVRLRPVTLPPQVEQLVESGVVKRGSSLAKKKRSGMCVHRVPAGSWCKRCEED